MNPREHQVFVAEALADPSGNIHKSLSELSRVREQLKRSEDDKARYKAVFRFLLKPTEEFLQGLAKCKSYKELDEYSFDVLRQWKMKGNKVGKPN